MGKHGRIAAAAVLAAGCVAPAEVWLKDDKLVTAVEKRVHSLQPSRQERRFDEVGWAPDILAAEALAKEHRRPVFLFTYDGDIDTGRC